MPILAVPMIATQQTNSNKTSVCFVPEDNKPKILSNEDDLIFEDFKNRSKRQTSDYYSNKQFDWSPKIRGR